MVTGRITNESLAAVKTDTRWVWGSFVAVTVMMRAESGLIHGRLRVPTVSMFSVYLVRVIQSILLTTGGSFV